MKQLTQYIQEKLHVGKFKKTQLKYFPKNKNELKDIITQVCKDSKDLECVDLNCIDISNITDLSHLFTHNYIKDALKDRTIDISEWDVSNVRTFFCMFDYYQFNTKASNKFNFDLSKWDVSNGYDFNSMFSGLTGFEGKGLEYWNMKNAKRIAHMFQGCTNLNCDLSSWQLKDLEREEYNYVFDETNLPKEKRPKYKNRTLK